MTDQMDIDSVAMPVETGLDDGGSSIPTSSSTSTEDKEEDLMDFSDPEQQGFVAVSREGMPGGSTRETRAKKRSKTWWESLTGSGLNLISRDRHQRSHEPRIEYYRSRFTKFQARSELLEKANRRIEKEKTNATKKIESLEFDLELVQQAYSQLRRQNKVTGEERSQLLTQNADLKQELGAAKDDHRREIAQLKNQIRDLSGTNDRLRGMIIPVSEKQIPDADVVSRFTDLRNGIEGLVRQTWKLAFKEGLDHNQLSQEQQRLFISHIPLSYNRLRGVVFNILHIIILGSPSYFLGPDFDKIEHAIQHLEKDLFMKSPPGDRQRVIEWRNATFKATERFRDNGMRLSSICQDRIWGLMSILQTKNEESVQTGRTKLKVVCDSAVELSLMTRQLKDNFWIDGLYNHVGKRGTNPERFLEEVESLPADVGHHPGTMAYVVFGLLTKSPKEDHSKTLILEKAEVALFE